MEFLELQLKDQARARFAMSAAGFAFGVPMTEMRIVRRGPSRSSLARQVAMYVAHVGMEMSLARVAAAFARDRSTVAYACHRIEDMRDQPAFDALVASLEEMARAAPEPSVKAALAAQEALAS
jgi:chromosomal replication initiation ATPase DnaA